MIQPQITDDEAEAIERSLKPCPHCGGVTILERWEYYWIQCIECAAHTAQDKLEVCVEKWNRRV